MSVMLELPFTTYLNSECPNIFLFMSLWLKHLCKDIMKEQLAVLQKKRKKVS